MDTHNNIFPTLIGNENLKRSVGRDIRSGINSHAYIIEGDKGSGKRTIAELIAAAVSCERRFESDHALPCGECNNCKKIKKGIFTDLVRIDSGDKATIGIDAVRTIREGLYVTPNDSDTRTYIIESADKLTPQAQNGLLLSIEEPPSFVLFLLLVEDSTKLLETVRSRAQLIRCESFSSTQIAEYLKSQPGGTELARKNPSKFAAVVSMCGGSIGKALVLLRGNDEGKYLLKCRENTLNMVSGFITGKSAALLKLLPSFTKSADEASTVFALADNALRDLCVLKNSEHEAFLTFFVSRAEAEELLAVASYKKLLHVHDCICKALRQLHANVPVKTVFINLVLSCQNYRR